MTGKISATQQKPHNDGVSFLEPNTLTPKHLNTLTPKPQEWKTWQEFEEAPWTPQKMLCGNWLPEAGICMLWGPRGAAKSWTALALGASIATGQGFLGWKTQEAGVLYLDAEMNPAQLTKRMRELRIGRNFDLGKLNKRFTVISHALSLFKDTGFPKLHAGMQGWKILRQVVKDRNVKLLELDNLSSLTRVGNEYEAPDWNYVRDQLLWFRRHGVTTLLVHHAGKPDIKGHIDQRGTSFREDIMDTVVKVMVKHQEDKATKVKWQFTKVREGYQGPSFEFEIRTSEEATVLEQLDPEAQEVELLKMNGQGKSLRAIEAETGISRSTLSRKLRRLKGNEIPDRMI